jgi:hypothetical protein
LHLKQVIFQIISAEASPDAVRKFIEESHKIALICLKQKVRSGRLAPHFFKIGLDDLALDCIADLFRRDECGTFHQLISYYSPLISPTSTEEELFMLTRRLIFGKVNQELFRLYSDEDPGLSKIIRNLKRSIKFVPQLLAERREGEVWVYLDSSDRDLPFMPAEYMEARLSEHIAICRSFRGILTAFSEVLAGQSEYRKIYPLTGLAIICKTLFGTLSDYPPVTGSEEVSLYPEEIDLYIEESIRFVRQKAQKEYIDKGKLSSARYNRYFPAIREILIAQYVHDNGFEKSFYEYLISHMPNLTPEVYKSEHRSIFEYLVKLTRQRLLKNIRYEL